MFFCYNNKKERRSIMQITKIEVQKKKQNRFNIYINDEFAFGVDEATLLKFALTKGTELTQDTIREIEQETQYQNAYQKALHFLNFKLRTAKEVYEKLEKLEVSDEVINQVLQQLMDHGFVNDQFYAESYVRENFALQKKGPKAVAFELKKKGVNDSIIHKALAEFDEATQLDQAIEIAQKYVDRQGNVPVKTVKQKVYGFLMQKGYDLDIVQSVISELTFEKQEENEEELVMKQGERILKTLLSKYAADDSQLWYQLKGKLYQKGFSSSAIDEAIEKLKWESEEWI